MSVVHKKVSLVDDSASTADIKAANWNEEHCYGPGSMVPIGILQLSFDASGFVSSNGFGGVSAAQRLTDGSYSAPIDSLSQAAIPDGYEADYLAFSSISSMPPEMASMKFLLSAGGGSVDVTIIDSASIGIDPTSSVVITVTVWACIISPPPPSV